MQLLGLNALPHWGYGTAIALSGVIASSAAQAQDSGGGGGAGGTGGSGDAGDSGPGTGGPEYGGGGGGDGGGGTGGGDTGGGGTGGTGGSGGAGGDNANSSSGSNTGSNGGGYGGGYSNANSGANGEGYGAATTTADANTGMAGTSNAPAAGASENSVPGQEGVTNSNAPADPNAPGVAGFFGGDLNAPGAAPTGIAGLGVSTGQALGNSPALGLGIDNGALGLTPSAQTQSELGVTTSAVSETPIGATPEVNSTPIGCGGACTAPGTALSLGISAGLAAMLGMELGANLTVTLACSCIQDISVSGSATAVVGYASPSAGYTASISTTPASQYNSKDLTSMSVQGAVNIGGQQITFDDSGMTGLQVSKPSVALTGGVQVTGSFSLTNSFNNVTNAIGNFISSAINTYTNTTSPRGR